MSRPRADQDQRVAAYRMWKLAVGPAKIHSELKVYVGAGQYGDYAVVVSLRTVKNWLRDFRTLDAKLDDTFQWHRLEEYGLPWEAGSFLLGLWGEVREINQSLRLLGWFRGSDERLPTVRQARWWWRVHLAVPEMETKINVYLWAEEFCRLELYQHVLGKPMDAAGLEAYLAYKPWTDEGSLAIYNEALFSGRIPYLPDPFEEFGGDGEQAMIRSRQVSQYMGTMPGGINPSNPGQLPTENLKNSLKDIGELAMKTRELEARLDQLESEATTKGQLE